MKQTLVGTGAALASTVAVTVVMVPLRSHLGEATTALVLVVPVVIGVVSGGFAAGALSVVAGFFAYDFFFIPPYLTLTVGRADNWVPLGVYAAVMLLVSRVVAVMNAARARARRQGAELRELFGLSDLLVADKPVDALLPAIATTLADVFASRQVALLLPQGDHLQVAASAGEPLTDAQLQRLLPSPGMLTRLDAAPSERDGLLVVALTAAERPIGLLALSADTAARHEREPLLLFANHVALAVERAQLREQVLRTRLDEEVSRLAKTLVAAVSHDLRTPLASIKASSSTLADAEITISPEATRRLASLIDVQADRLADLVQNLLDMSRIQGGVLQPRYSIAPLDEVTSTVLSDLAPALRNHVVEVHVPADLPPIDGDLVLISRVLTNLLENARRHGPKGTVIRIDAILEPAGVVLVSVSDRGPGVGPERRGELFELFARRDGDAGAGLGLTIAKTFVEAHGQRIWVDDAPGGGARFCFTLPVAAPMPEEPRLATHTHH